MRQTALFVATLAVNSSTMVGGAAAIEPKDATYYCTASVSGGVKLDKKSGNWDSVTFKIRPDDKLVLKLKFLSDAAGYRFRVTIRKGYGSGHDLACENPTEDSLGVEVFPLAADQRLSCHTHQEQFEFNLVNNRYMEIYQGGYLLGDDLHNPDSPFITVGTCLKVD